MILLGRVVFWFQQSTFQIPGTRRLFSDMFNIMVRNAIPCEPRSISMVGDNPSGSSTILDALVGKFGLISLQHIMKHFRFIS